MGHDINIHDIKIFHYINTVEVKSAAAADSNMRDGSEVNTNNILRVTEEYLNDVQKQRMAQAVDGFKEACLQSSALWGEMGRSSRRVPPYATSHITINEDPMRF